MEGYQEEMDMGEEQEGEEMEMDMGEEMENIQYNPLRQKQY
jgi:hypothetical protein